MTDLLYSAVLGFVAGLLPVYLGLLPLALFRRLSTSARRFLVSFSVGILLFLFADVTGEAVGLSGHTWYGALLFAFGLVIGIGVPFAISSRRNHVKDGSSAGATEIKPLTTYIISVAIGLHNLGEGLAIGAAYAGGQLALTTVLGWVLLFTMEPKVWLLQVLFRMSPFVLENLWFWVFLRVFQRFWEASLGPYSTRIWRVFSSFPWPQEPCFTL